MRSRDTTRHVWFVVVLVAFVFSHDVHAYLDPGTGSLVFQTVVAAFAAAAYAIRSYWGRIRIMFGARETTSSSESSDGQV